MIDEEYQELKETFKAEEEELDPLKRVFILWNKGTPAVYSPEHLRSKLGKKWWKQKRKLKKLERRLEIERRINEKINANRV